MAVTGVVDSLVGRAIRDQSFRNKFLGAPLTAAEEAGYSLTSDDRRMLSQLDGEKASVFFQKMESEGTPMAWCSDCTCYESEGPDQQCEP